MDNTATATSTSGDTITNSTDSNDNVKDVDGVGGQRLKAFIERIERLEEELLCLTS